MIKWKQLSGNEKAMVGIILFLVLMVLLNWSRVSDGLKKGYSPLKKEIPANNNN